MKEFEQWWNKEYSWRDYDNYAAVIYAEESWEAALRWVENLFQQNLLHDVGINVRECVLEELRKN